VEVPSAALWAAPAFLGGCRRLQFVLFILLYRVYIDEAGDRGRASGSSEHFVVSAVVVRDENDAAVREQLNTSKALLGFQPETVLHFRKLSHSKKVKICQEIGGFSVGCIISTVVCKRRLEPFASSGLSYLSNPDPLYLWAVRLVLERISWFVRDDGGGSALVTFAHLTRFKAKNLHNYRKALRHSETSIHWSSFSNHPFRINAPDKIHLLQVADCTASAVFKAVEKDPFGITERRYLAELRPVIYRYGTSPVTSYGLKVFPSNVASAGGTLHFLQQH
jgi:Protein of unknown function (DUF3800)